jgi:hypothetical protein
MAPHTSTVTIGPRIGFLVGAGLTAFLALGALAIGLLAFWGEDMKDDDGYISSSSHRFATTSRALVSASLDVDLDGLESLVDSTGFGDIRLKVDAHGEKPVFVGIARTDEVGAYLSGVSHSEVRDVEFDPFHASYKPHAGRIRPAPPAGQDIWAASVTGHGRQTLHWDARDGDWSVVVMNADGSRRVEADVSAGAKFPYLEEIGYGALGGGAGLLATAGMLSFLGLRRTRAGDTPATH